MREISGFYTEIGEFDSYVGDILIINNNIILPIYNIQLAKHPLNDTQSNIIHLDYCYFLFRNVFISKRDVYINNKDFFRQTNYINKEILQKKQLVFMLELLDFNNTRQYWNWEIKAESFSLIIENSYKIRDLPFSKKEIDKTFFEKDHTENLLQQINF